MCERNGALATKRMMQIIEEQMWDKDPNGSINILIRFMKGHTESKIFLILSKKSYNHIDKVGSINKIVEK